MTIAGGYDDIRAGTKWIGRERLGLGGSRRV